MPSGNKAWITGVYDFIILSEKGLKMSLLVCAATGREMSALAPDIFPDPAVIPELQPMLKEGGRENLIFLVTGIGPINAALAIGYSLGLKFDNSPEKDPVRAILYAGLAGAFDLERDPLCSIRVVRKEIWPEYGLHDGLTVTSRAFRFPLWARKEGDDIYDSVPLAGVEAISSKALPKEWKECASLTVAGVSASFNRREALWNAWRAELENMEGFAAAYAALRASLPCVELRVVSNKVGPRGRHEKDFSGALTKLTSLLPNLNILK